VDDSLRSRGFFLDGILIGSYFLSFFNMLKKIIGSKKKIPTFISNYFGNKFFKFQKTILYIKQKLQIFLKF